MRSSLVRLTALLLLIPFAAAAQSGIRFGVLGLFHPHTLEVSRTGHGALMVSGAGDTIVLNGEVGHRSITVLAAHGQLLLAGRAARGITVSARGGDNSAIDVKVPGRFHRVYEGKLDIVAREDELVPVIDMDIETAVATIVASEMPQDSPLEALKAQAVVTRSFLAAGRRHPDYDFCDTTHCQYMRSPMEVSRRVWIATDATRGIILTWRGKPLAALYSSRCGGTTRSLRQAGIDPGEGYAYYSVECPWCQRHPLRESKRRQGQDRHWGAMTSPNLYEAIAGGTKAPPASGHGIGMCQRGAAGMALAGADFRSVLAHYYPNTEFSSAR